MKRKYIVFALIAVIFLCALSYIYWTISNNGQSGTEEAASVTEVVASATETPAEPPLTPTTTNTPRPTFTLTPAPNEAPINETPTPIPTATSSDTVPEATTTPSESIPEATATLGEIAPGGLGLSQAEWEQNHEETGEDFLGPIYDDKYTVTFLDGNVWLIVQEWARENAVTSDAVELESQNLIPQDAELIETYSPEGRPETIVNVYLSESLKDRFDSDLWTGGEPGNFTVQYNVQEEGVTSLVIGIGNNP